MPDTFCNGYPYESLPDPSTHLRLITFLPPAEDGSLRLDLVEHELCPELRYNALSYEWGDGVRTCTIHVNGIQVQIYQNLYNFLLELQRSHTQWTAMPIFADALCINQTDLVERNAQVQIMSSIYRQATSVLACLGDANALSDLFFELLPDRPWWARREVRPSYREVMLDFWLRSYWTRLWIFQELCLGQKVMLFCGTKSLNYEHVQSSDRPWDDECMEMLMSGRLSATQVRWLDHGKYLWQGTGSTGTGFSSDTELSHLICLVGGASCSRIHDKVYGLFGVIDHNKTEVSRPQVVEVDYNEPVLALFCRVLATMPTKIDLGATHRIYKLLELHRSIDASNLEEGQSSQLPHKLAGLEFDILLNYVGTVGKGLPSESNGSSSNNMQCWYYQPSEVSDSREYAMRPIDVSSAQDGDMIYIVFYTNIIFIIADDFESPTKDGDNPLIICGVYTVEPGSGKSATSNGTYETYVHRLQPLPTTQLERLQKGLRYCSVSDDLKMDLTGLLCLLEYAPAGQPIRTPHDRS
jgi:hypothetical protein